MDPDGESFQERRLAVADLSRYDRMPNNTSKHQSTMVTHCPAM
jgi:hypothetical protein